MTKAGFRKCLQDKVVREPRNCDSDKGGEHRGLKQEQDIQQLRGGKKEQTEKAFQKRQQREKSRDRSLNAGVYKLRPAHRRHNKMLGKWVLPRPTYAH